MIVGLRCDTEAAVRTFNTDGPVVAAEHYCIHPLERVDLKQILDLIRLKKYFVLHAPRQTGKTSTLLALAARLNADGEYRCLYINVAAQRRAPESLTLCGFVWYYPFCVGVCRWIGLISCPLRPAATREGYW